MSDIAALPSRRYAWTLTLAAIATGAILVPLNSTMLAVALPSIMREFQVSASAVAWLVTAYLAAVAIAMPLSGNAGDRLGHRRMFLAGVGAFAGSSLLGAVAWSFPILILSRVLQAASGASITTNSVALVQTVAPEDRRGSSFGLMEMFISTSAASGPFLGGLLVSAFGWRSLFMMAVPVAILSALLLRALVPPREVTAEPPPLDAAGLGLLAVLLLSVLAALSGIRTHNGWAWYAAPLVPVLLALFIARELRAPVPAMDVRLFAVPPFAAAVAAVFGATIILHAMMILIPILTQNLLGASAAGSGIVMFVYFGVGAVMAPLGGRLSDIAGRRLPAVTGALCMTAGLAVLWMRAPSVTLAGVGLLLGLIGLGSGLSGAPRQTSAIESVPAQATGMAAGTYFTVRYLGGVLGASLAGVVLTSGVTTAVMAGGFKVLAFVSGGVALASLGLRGRRKDSPRWP